MHCNLTPAETALLQERPDTAWRLYRGDDGRVHRVSYVERTDHGLDGYTRRVVVCWNPEALGRGIIVLSPDAFLASTEPVPAPAETGAGEGLTA